jgi:hypothetical protein
MTSPPEDKEEGSASNNDNCDDRCNRLETGAGIVTD